jgi:peroxiredoxin
MPTQIIFNLFRQIKFNLLSLTIGSLLIACQSDTQQMVPTFKVSEISGKVLSQEDLKGKVSIINFWATSCTTCVKEMPEMIQTYNKYKMNQLEFIAVAMSYDPPMYVVNFAKTRQLPFHVAMDSDGSVAKAFGKIQLTPTTLVINKKGEIIKRYVGEPNWDEFHQLLEKSLAEKT